MSTPGNYDDQDSPHFRPPNKHDASPQSRRNNDPPLIRESADDVEFYERPPNESSAMRVTAAVFAIIYGSLGLLCCSCGNFATGFAKQPLINFLQDMQRNQNDNNLKLAIADLQAIPTWYPILSGGLWLVLASLWLFGGIGMLKCSRVAAWLAFVASLLAILLTLGGTAYSLSLQQQRDPLIYVAPVINLLMLLVITVLVSLALFTGSSSRQLK